MGNLGGGEEIGKNRRSGRSRMERHPDKTGKWDIKRGRGRSTDLAEHLLVFLLVFFEVLEGGQESRVQRRHGQHSVATTVDGSSVGGMSPLGDGRAEGRRLGGRRTGQHGRWQGSMKEHDQKASMPFFSGRSAMRPPTRCCPFLWGRWEGPKVS